MIDISVVVYCAESSQGKVLTAYPKVKMSATVGAGWNVDKLENVRQQMELLLQTELPKCIRGLENA